MTSSASSPWLADARVMGCLALLAAAGDGRNDRHGDAVANFGVKSVEVADVIVVDENVYELPQAAIFVNKPVAESRVSGLKRANDFGEWAGFDQHLLVAPSQWAHGGRNSNGHSHVPQASGAIPYLHGRQLRTDSASNVPSVGIKRVVAAPDKFRGTVSAQEAARAIGHACWELGIECDEVPMADGGDGLLDALGGANRTTVVTGPLGDPVEAGWRLAKDTAVIEMARASGLSIAGGSAGNEPLDATTAGTGELIDHALDAGARRIIVGLGGSATTDGGFGAIRAITAIARLKQVELLVACDVTTTFTAAAEVFGPQKGASPAEVKMLTRRLERMLQMFQDDFDADVSSVRGGGAAGGLGGALAALGGTLLPGFELVADEVDLYDCLDGADLIVTGEGSLDKTSFEGKVVGGVATIASDADIPVLAIVGSADPAVMREHGGISVISLEDRFGAEAAFAEPKHCIERAATDWLSAPSDGVVSRLL